MIELRWVVYIKMQLVLLYTKWLGDHQLASRSQMLGDCQWHDSGDSQIQIDYVPYDLNIWRQRRQKLAC